ncbi:MAG: hypothetical protein ACRENX_02910 [Candidatus Dormibacteria bacterium]
MGALDHGKSGRTSNGRFKPGCTPGPGRPRRATESLYLATLADACPIANWRRIAERAVRDAEAGDAKAREWLARYLLPSSDGCLTAIAAAEEAEYDPVAVQASRLRLQEAESRQNDDLARVLADLSHR